MISSAVGWRERFLRLRGSSVQYDLSAFDGPLADINGMERELRALSDPELRARSRSLTEEARSGAPRERLRTRAFALAREAALRAVGLRPFDVQMVAALALDGGAVVEMQTGEGKTLAAVMPAYLNALCGQGVHVLTFNDYLARRDAEWMGPAYALLGLSVAWVEGGLSRDRRRDAYRADVTYVTAKEPVSTSCATCWPPTPPTWSTARSTSRSWTRPTPS